MENLHVRHLVLRRNLHGIFDNSRRNQRRLSERFRYRIELYKKALFYKKNKTDVFYNFYNLINREIAPYALKYRRKQNE